MSVLFKPCMFLTSFTPLWAAIIYLDFVSIYQQNDNIATEKFSIFVILLLMLASAVDLYFEFRYLKKYNRPAETIYFAEKDKDILPTFIFSFALPLCAFDFTTHYGMVSFLLFFIPIMLICVKNNIIFPNIILMLFGYNFYKCRFSNDEGAHVFTVITKRGDYEANIGTDIHVYPINNDVRIAID